MAGAEAAAIIAQTAAQVIAFGSLTTAVGTVTTAITAHAATLTSYAAAEQTAVTGVAVAELVLYGAQLAIYYNAAGDSIDDRDDAIDDQVSFMQYLHDTKFNIDLPMVQDKVRVLVDLELPDTDECTVGNNVASSTKRDGIVVDSVGYVLSTQAPQNVPNTFKQTSGSITGAKYGSYGQSIVVNSEVRRKERFRKNKTQLVRQAQLGSKSIYNAGEILSQYAQVVGIHSGLADLYIQGFNSAGAGLGVALGQLATGTGQGNTSGSAVSSTGTGNTSGSPTP